MAWRRSAQLIFALGALAGLGASTSKGLSEQTPLAAPPGWRVFKVPPTEGGFVLKFQGPPGFKLTKPSPAPSSAQNAAPHGDPPKKKVATESEKSPQALRQDLLNRLFRRLKGSADDAEASGVASAIERIWFVSGSDTSDLLMRRALFAETAHHFEPARDILEQVVRLDPHWAEAWYQLGALRLQTNDRSGAMEDFAHALALEPRQFNAMIGLGAILVESGNKKGALEALRGALRLYPRFDEVKAFVERLTIEVDGRDL